MFVTRSCHLYGSPGWIVLCKVVRVDFVDRGEVVDVGQEDRGLDDVVKCCTSKLKCFFKSRNTPVSLYLEDLSDVVQRLDSLLLQTLHHLASLRVQTNLTGDVEDVIHPHRLVVRTNWSWSLGASVDYSVMRGRDNLEMEEYFLLLDCETLTSQDRMERPSRESKYIALY